MTLRFSCPNCSTALNAPPAAVGKQLPCPKCNETVVVPAQEPTVDLLSVEYALASADPLGAVDPLMAEVVKNALVPSAAEWKQCPYCLQQVPAAALKCKHCGEFVEKPDKAVRGGVGAAKPKAENTPDLTGPSIPSQFWLPRSAAD